MDGSIPKERFASLAENTDLVFQSCSMTFDKKEHYPKYPVPEGKTATCLMEQRARAAIPKLYGKDGWTADREEKLKEEIAVIDKTGYSDYTLTIADILNDARAMAAPEVISCLVGPGRGSGAGSLVNYLMGITSLDPVEYGLIFERYLNIERVSPPDIDSDIATSIRDALVSKIKEKYKKKEGSIGVCGILTKNRLTAKAAIRAAGRILSHKQYGNTTALYSLSDRMSKSLPSDPKLKLSGHTNELKESFTSKDAAKILHYALLLEGTVQAYGTHAAESLSQTAETSRITPRSLISAQKKRLSGTSIRHGGIGIHRAFKNGHVRAVHLGHLLYRTPVNLCKAWKKNRPLPYTIRKRSIP